MTLSPPEMEDRIFLPARGAAGRGVTTALSAMAHLAALGLLLTIATEVPPAPPDPPAIPLVFGTPPPSLSANPPAPANVPLATVQLARAAPPAAIAMLVAPHAASHFAGVAPARHAVTAPQAPTAPQQSAGPSSIAMGKGSPTAAPQSNDAEAQRIEMAQLKDGIHAAVQASAVMPAAARRQHREGRAEVRFSYLDGAVAEIALAQSSQSRLLDDAALAAVARARYPAPPTPLRGHKIPMVLWIEFHMATASAEG